MNSAEKQRILAAYDRASLMAALASRGFYVIGEVWRDRPCGQPPAAHGPGSSSHSADQPVSRPQDS